MRILKAFFSLSLTLLSSLSLKAFAEPTTKEMFRKIVEANNNLEVYQEVRQQLIANGNALFSLVPSGKTVGYVDSIVAVDPQSNRAMFISTYPNGIVRNRSVSQPKYVDLPMGHFEVGISRIATAAEKTEILAAMQKDPSAFSLTTLKDSQRISSLFRSSNLRLFGVLSQYADILLKDGTPVVTKGYTTAKLNKETNEVVIKESVQIDVSAVSSSISIKLLEAAYEVMTSPQTPWRNCDAVLKN